MTDYYGEEGCCLVCEESFPGCLCYQCKCRKCDHYEGVYGEGSCDLAVGTTWEDYEKMAENIQHLAHNKFGNKPRNLKATFSNGTIEKTVYYVNAFDIPCKIRYYLETYSYRTLLLKKIEEQEKELLAE